MGVAVPTVLAWLQQAGYAWCLENYGTLLFVQPSEFKATIAAMEALEEFQRK